MMLFTEVFSEQWHYIRCYFVTQIVFIIYDIYDNVFRMNLNEKYIGRCLNDKVVNHLCHADDLVLIFPTASDGVNSRLRELVDRTRTYVS